ncbi:sigma-54 interaction domain-containing protein [Kyrpidia tusciae]|uniref:HTH-type transcriptional regulatory protein TyrR n=1 Tax=Kyrpidia tusciae (strain DSM 2912 / NBRC 15312 / T2) TaxID=562970 RepID=D5WVI7_KYRT2|nr:sigma 54-interacting transcriptional regulator [Kyrpidia tusciae]ADG07530.1 putative sigma54 specific transcriptional regulator [Kyrpidia tusciae DSM 2912]
MKEEQSYVRILENRIQELEMVFQSSHDEIFVTDEHGVCIRVNPACERHYGLAGIELVGRNVFDMEREKIFYPSATRLVLEQGNPVTLIQSTGTGKRLHVTANPVFDKDGKLIRVVSNSLDITEILTLKQQLEEMEKMIESYNAQLRQYQRHAGFTGDGLVAKSKPFQNALQILRRVAYVDTTVLLLGESGVGKSEVARWLHEQSDRRAHPFIELNCAAIPPALFESELFGYEPGAFSGALKSGQLGLLELADKGTLFLDEVSELPLEQQTKLLQVVQNRTFRRVGGREIRRVDVRFIAATNEDLPYLVEKGRFRKDLFYRLSTIPVHIPPLRERPEDLIEMIFLFMDRINRKYNFKKVLSPDVIKQLLEYDWPGNVRELQNVLERLAVTSDSDYIRTVPLHATLHKGVDKNPPGKETTYGFREIDRLKSLVEDSHLQLEKLVAEFESAVIAHLMKELRSTRKVALRLGVSQSTISRKCRKYGLQ